MQTPRENSPRPSIFSRIIAFSSNVLNRLRGRATPAADLSTDESEHRLKINFDVNTNSYKILNHLSADGLNPPINLKLNVEKVALPNAVEEALLRAVDQDKRPSRFQAHLEGIINNLPQHCIDINLRDAQEWYFNSNPTANKEETNAEKLELFDRLDLNIPDEFICPITLQIMTDPVFAPGYPQKYERSAITAWVKEHRNNPVNRQPLNSRNLVADQDLKAKIDQFVENTIRELRTMIQP